MRDVKCRCKEGFNAMNEADSLAQSDLLHQMALSDVARLLAAGDSSELDLLQARLRAATLALPRRFTEVRTANKRLLSAIQGDALAQQSAEANRVLRDAMVWELQSVQDELGGIRAQIADLSAREVAQASIKAAEETARAARVTARATVYLAVATAVLIIATLVAAVIASG